MKRWVLDTSVLIVFWRRSVRRPLDEYSPDDARGWARRLIALEETDAIVTPVYLEMVAGTQSQQEARLTRAYLEPFRILDGGRVIDQDWREACRRGCGTHPAESPAAAPGRLPDPGHREPLEPRCSDLRR
jgi:hypothetical protein